MKRAPMVERFWSKVDRSAGPNACWPWLAGRSPKGYGTFERNNKTERANRVAFEIANGRPGVPFVLHRCPGGGNPWCCNPAHLVEGTAAENMRDKVAAGRVSRNGPEAKLSPAQVLDIRSRPRFRGDTRAWAKEFGISLCVLNNVLAGKSWRPGSLTWKRALRESNNPSRA
jgi:hypothetical protein